MICVDSSVFFSGLSCLRRVKLGLQVHLQACPGHTSFILIARNYATLRIALSPSPNVSPHSRKGGANLPLPSYTQGLKVHGLPCGGAGLRGAHLSSGLEGWRLLAVETLVSRSRDQVLVGV